MTKKTVNALLLSLCLASLNPMPASAKESKVNYEKDELIEMAKKYGKKIVEGAEKIDNKINETVVEPTKDKLGDIPLYDEDSLWLVTDIPEVDPSLERHYFFVNKNIPPIKTTTYFNKYGKKVNRNADHVVLKYEKEMYISLTDTEDTFLIERYYYLQNYKFTENYIELDTEDMWCENTLAAYGIVKDVSTIIPEDKRKDKYSTNDLSEIIEIVSDVEYTFDSLSLERSK